MPRKSQYIVTLRCIVVKQVQVYVYATDPEDAKTVSRKVPIHPAEWRSDVGEMTVVDVAPRIPNTPLPWGCVHRGVWTGGLDSK